MPEPAAAPLEPMRLHEEALYTHDERSRIEAINGWDGGAPPHIPHRQPFVAVIEDGRAVAVCASVRITRAAHEAGVETVPRYRGRGHAVDAVAGWAEAVAKLGAVALYSTSWDNVASRRLAARLGLQVIGVDFHIV